MLIEHMKKGHSFKTFGGIIGVCEKTLFNWSEEFPEFLQSKGMGETASHLHWEAKGMEWLVCPGGEGAPKFNNPVWQTTMKNRFGYRDKVTHTTEDEEGKQQPLNLGLTGSEITACIDRLRKEIEAEK